jgi:hypothetical protein
VLVVPGDHARPAGGDLGDVMDARLLGRALDAALNVEQAASS